MSANVDEYVYPRPGETNATSVLCTVEFSHLTGDDAPKPIIKKHDKLLKEHFPWCEYVPRAGWTACGKLYVHYAKRHESFQILTLNTIYQNHTPTAAFGYHW